MARTLFKAASLISRSFNRKGYSASVVASTVKVGRSKSSEEEKVGEKKTKHVASNSWAPDPITGYYRPGNQKIEKDAVELRKIHLSDKS